MSINYASRSMRAVVSIRKFIRAHLQVFTYRVHLSQSLTPKIKVENHFWFGKTSEMDLLWKKESSEASSYVDIFASIDENSVEKKLQNLKLGIAVEHNKKNNQLSTNYRLHGNAQFTAGNWRIAMGFYNLSLRFAEIGTENVGLAYANRSSCFLKLEMFDKCITDIDMALLANYPKEKKSKLEGRRASCLQQLETKKPNEKGEKPI